MNDNIGSNAARDWLKLLVLSAQNGERLGRVADIFIHPTNGTLLGLAIETDDGEGHLLLPGNFSVTDEAVIALSENSFLDSTKKPEGAVSACQEILGAKVITEDGHLLGRVRDVRLSDSSGRATYRIVPSLLQGILGAGFLMSSDTPNSYCQDGWQRGSRLIVPTWIGDPSERLARSQRPSEKMMVETIFPPQHRGYAIAVLAMLALMTALFVVLIR